MPNASEPSPSSSNVGPAGQSRLLGWHLDARALEFLRLTHADLDVDEYAYADE
jgi:hypothetical protein